MVMTESMMIESIAEELSIGAHQVRKTIELLDADNTVPFISRYRKEMTGALDEEYIRTIQERIAYLRQLNERKETILQSIREQDKLTPDLEKKIQETRSLTELEDLYLPYKPKRRTRAMIAKEKGLEPLANQFIAQAHTTDSLEDLCEPFIDIENDLFTQLDVLKGVRDIIAEHVSDNAEFRKWIREYTLNYANVVSKVKDASENSDFEMYFDYEESIQKLPPHRILALFRGEHKKELKVSIDIDEETITHRLKSDIILNDRSVWADQLALAIEDGYKRLIQPSIDREVRQALMEKAEEHAIEIFGVNLKNLLLQPPVEGRVVLGLDPGFRTGCKVAIVDETGKYLDDATIYPHAPQNRWEEAKLQLKKLIKTYHVNVIAIGNGTASRESEQLAAELISETTKDLAYVIVNEAGASVYSASPLAKEEFPELDVTIRGAISIARRLIDPLAELVKIDPKSIGVGLYQHDVDQKKLASKLDFVIESAVNHVGVDLNTASPALLQHVSGLTKRTAQNIVKMREETGKFLNRKQLMKVTGVGAAAFEQSAGFLKIKDGNEPLDNTQIHPESYSATKELLKRFEIRDVAQGGSLLKLKIKQSHIDLEDLAEDIGVGELTLSDILENIEKPGRDPRDEMEKPILKSDVLKLEDLREGLWLKGTVRNVVDFGAFVDIGLKNDGLVHISELANQFVKNPTDVVSVGDVVDVRVLSIDTGKQRVGLSMKK